MKLNSVINTAADSLMGRGSGGAAPLPEGGRGGEQESVAGAGRQPAVLRAPPHSRGAASQGPHTKRGVCIQHPCPSSCKAENKVRSAVFSRIAFQGAGGPDAPCDIASRGLRAPPEPGLEFIVNVPLSTALTEVSGFVFVRVFQFVLCLLYPPISGCVR